jgi:ComG operon protein 7
MIKNEYGFTFPLSYSLFLVLSVFLLIHAEQYLSEKKLLWETETILKQEYYMMSSVKKMEKMLQENPDLITQGIFQYTNGKVNYKTNHLTNSVIQTTFRLKLDSGEEFLGFGFYDKDLRKMIKWVEKN